MSKFDEAMVLYKAQLNSINVDFDETQLTAVAKGLGPSIYNKDSSTVSGSDDTELERVKANFLIKKLGMEDSPALMEAVREVCVQLGTSNRSKYRAVVYYLLAQKFGKTL